MDDERHLEDGKLLLFTRNGIWQARVYIGGRRYLWKSLKTSDEREAFRAGTKLFHVTSHKLEEGQPVQSRPFSAVLDEYEAYREHDNASGKGAKRGISVKHTSDTMLRQIRRVSKFWHEYAGSRSVETIDDKVLKDFIPWRKAYYHGKKDLHPNAKLDPTDKTLQWEIMLAKMVLKYAHERGYLGKKSVPGFTYTPKIKRIRPHFTPTEFRSLRVHLARWIAKTDNPAWKQSRQLLHDYVLTLGMAGLRTGEANKLRVRDVAEIVDVDGRATIQLYVRGKTGTRTVQPHIELGPVLQALIERRGDCKPNDWLFVMPTGGQVINLIDQFNAFLKAAGLTHSTDGSKYSLYSLRHYYAVRSLNRADIYAVAQNMGTSVQMIEQYYGKHGISAERARKLAGEVGEAQRPEDPISRSRLRTADRQRIAQVSAAYIHWLHKGADVEELKLRYAAVTRVLQAMKLKASPGLVRQVNVLARDVTTEDRATILSSEKHLKWFETLRDPVPVKRDAL